MALPELLMAQIPSGRWEISSPETASFVDLSCSDSLNCIATGLHGNFVVYKTTDGGNTWLNTFEFGVGQRVRRIYSVSPNIALAASDSGDLFRTTDGGTTWLRRHFAPPMPANHIERPCISMMDRQNGIVAFQFKSDTAFQPRIDSLFITQDAGETWATVIIPNAGKGQWAAETFQDVAVLGPRTFLCIKSDFSARVNSALLRTTDAGNSWSELKLRDSMYYPSLSFVDSANGWYSGSIKKTERLHLERTRDGGITWQIIHDEYVLKNARTATAFRDTMNGIFAGLSTIPRTTDGGYTWIYDSTIEASKFFVDVNIAFPKGSYGFGLGIGRIYRYVQASADVTDVKERIASAYVLYPNPCFSGQPLQLQYSLEHKSHIIVTVHNLLGGMLRTLYDNELPPGEYTNVFQTSEIPTGLYLVRIQNGIKTGIYPVNIQR